MKSITWEKIKEGGAIFAVGFIITLLWNMNASLVRVDTAISNTDGNVVANTVRINVVSDKLTAVDDKVFKIGQEAGANTIKIQYIDRMLNLVAIKEDDEEDDTPSKFVKG